MGVGAIYSQGQRGVREPSQSEKSPLIRSPTHHYRLTEIKYKVGTVTNLYKRKHIEEKKHMC